MRRGWKAWIVAIVASFALAPAAGAQVPARSKAAAHHPLPAGPLRTGRSVWHEGGRIVYAPGPRGRSHRTGFADLVGDPDSGLGFYALPIQYRVGAWRYRMRNERPPWLNPIRFAIAADAARYNYWLPVGPNGYRYGVFNPNDGVGSPFFAGYYGPAGSGDEPPTLFGRPYRN